MAHEDQALFVPELLDLMDRLLQMGQPHTHILREIVDWAASHGLLTVHPAPVPELKIGVDPSAQDGRLAGAIIEIIDGQQRVQPLSDAELREAIIAPVSSGPADGVAAPEAVDPPAPGRNGAGVEDLVPIAEPSTPDMTDADTRPGASVAATPTSSRAEAAADGLKTGDWDAAEIAVLRRLREQGLMLSEIARRLGRDKKAVSNKLTRIGASGTAVAPVSVAVAPTSAPAPAPEPAPSPVADDPAPATAAPVTAPAVIDPPAAPPVRMQAFPDADALDRPLWWRKISAHLNALSYGGDWTPARDLALVEGFAKGRSRDEIADDLGVVINAVVQRFRSLMTERDRNDRPTIEGQTHLIEVLRWRARSRRNSRQQRSEGDGRAKFSENVDRIFR